MKLSASGRIGLCLDAHYSRQRLVLKKRRAQIERRQYDAIKIVEVFRRAHDALP